VKARVPQDAGRCPFALRDAARTVGDALAAGKPVRQDAAARLDGRAVTAAVVVLQSVFRDAAAAHRQAAASPAAR